MFAEDDSSPVGEFIRWQRQMQELTMRQLADLVGISNPYLSQIERGLREPSQRVLDAIARNLELSADTLHEHSRRARADEHDDQPEPEVVAAIRSDPHLNARQRAALVEVYEAFVERPRRRDAP